MNHRKVLQRLSRLLLGLLGAVIALAVGAASIQCLAVRDDERQFPPPGPLVDVGGHRLHIHCTGENGPTVVLEAMGDGTSINWAWVQPRVAEVTRACAYDRAGRGWSEPSRAPRDALQIARELHTLLANAGEAPPFVLVGHSFGGLVTRAYAATYPDQVAAMVIVDGGQPDIRSARFPAEGRQHQAEDQALMQVAPWLARLGVFRWRGLATDLPAPASAEFAAQYASTRLWDSLHGEMLALPVTDAQVRSAGSLGDRPLMIINANRPDDPSMRANNSMQLELCALSSNCERRIVDGATHGSLVFDPHDASETSAAVLDVVRAVRSGRRLTASNALGSIPAQ